MLQSDWSDAVKYVSVDSIISSCKTKKPKINSDYDILFPSVHIITYISRIFT